MILFRAACVLALLLPAAAAEADAPKTMVFNFYFDNTSPEPTTDAETARIKRVSDELRTLLTNSKQYDVVAGQEMAASSVPDFSKCTSQDVDQAQKAGSQYVACGWIQKVSNLILNVNLIIQDVKTGKAVHGGSVDIRGNTDESWDRGLKFLLDEHIFQNH
ncbi:MAG TPA: DUF3280 domain-containing protein [Methylovirgula sp.]|jgi:hypothetical protein